MHYVVADAERSGRLREAAGNSEVVQDRSVGHLARPLCLRLVHECGNLGVALEQRADLRSTSFGFTATDGHESNAGSRVPMEAQKTGL